MSCHAPYVNSKGGGSECLTWRGPGANAIQVPVVLLARSTSGTGGMASSASTVKGFSGTDRFNSVSYFCRSRLLVGRHLPAGGPNTPSPLRSPPPPPMPAPPGPPPPTAAAAAVAMLTVMWRCFGSHWCTARTHGVVMAATAAMSAPHASHCTCSTNKKVCYCVSQKQVSVGLLHSITTA